MFQTFQIVTLLQGLFLLLLLYKNKNQKIKSKNRFVSIKRSGCVLYITFARCMYEKKNAMIADTCPLL